MQHDTGYPWDGIYRRDYDGKGVDVYFIDTGIRSTHPQFAQREGRVECVYDRFNEASKTECCVLTVNSYCCLNKCVMSTILVSSLMMAD